MYLTHADVIRYNLEVNKPLTDSEILKDLITKDMNSPEKKRMEEGEAYFKVDNDILNEDFTLFKDEYGTTQSQEDKANNRIAHGFHRRQVIEKQGYLLRQEPTITHDDDIETKDEKGNPIKKISNVDAIKEVLGQDFNELLQDWVEGASNKGIEAIHPHINGNEFDAIVISSRELIPIYETSKQKKLLSVIRYYHIDVNTSGESKDRLKVEWWFGDRVDYYFENDLEILVFEESKDHFQEYEAFGDVVKPGSVKGNNWGEPPFIFLKNNSQAQSDLEPIKTMIDAYDRSQSVLSNNLEDIQEAMMHVSGCNEEPSKIRANMRKFKVAVSEDSEGKITFHTIQIPTEARQFEMKNLEEDIFAFGMGINPKTDKFGGDPSGIALQWLYMPLDLKAYLLEVRLKSALSKLMWFACKYIELTAGKAPDPKGFKFTFTKTMISNETEKIDNFVKAKGSISDETALENMPWVEDVQEEIEKIKADEEAKPKIDLNFIDEETDEENPQLQEGIQGVPQQAGSNKEQGST